MKTRVKHEDLPKWPAGVCVNEKCKCKRKCESVNEKCKCKRKSEIVNEKCKCKWKWKWKC